MPREVIEYRAVGVDLQDGEEYREAEGWTEDRGQAERDLAEMRAYQAMLSFDETYLERRVTVFGEPERVKEGESDA